MSNVLPSAAQKELWSFYRAHLILIGSLVLLAGACMALIILLPSFIATGLSQSKDSTAKEDPLLTAVQAEEERTEMLRARALITQFLPLASSTAPALDALSAALSVRPKGALVSEIQYTRKEKGTIVLNGTASGRAAISAYRDVLEENPLFETVSVPVGVFVGAEGGKFSITLTGAF